MSEPKSIATAEIALDKNPYIREFRELPVIKYIVVFLICFLIFQTFITLENGSTIFSEFAASFPHGHLVNVFLIFIFGVSLFFLFSNLSKSLYPSPKSVIRFLLAYSFYLLFIRFSDRFVFFSFELWGFNWMYYTDILAFACGISMLNYQVYAQPLQSKSKYGLQEDHPDINGAVDEFSRESYAETVVEYICGTSTKAAFNIGIFAEWGAGKTDFLLRMKSIIDRKNLVKHENILVEFNPWRAGKADILFEDFFDTLSEQLRPYNKSISSKIKSYSEQLFKPGKELHFRIFDALINDLTKDSSIKTKFDEINNLIVKTGKRLVIFVDDIDRLTGPEVFQVLKIVRNTANFANTFFVVGLDEQYVVDSLKHTKSIKNESQYLKKIFQLSVTLPVVKKDVFQRKIKEFLGFEQMEVNDKNRIDLVLNFIDQNKKLLSTCFENMRDIKRFCNSFKISYSMLKDDLEVKDLAVLEILKLNFMPYYAAIANGKLFNKQDSSEYYALRDTEFKQLASEYPESGSKVQLLVDALLDTNFKNDRKLASPANFYLYFSYQLFDLIPLKEFNELVKKPTEDVLNGFKNFINKGKEINLVNIISVFPIDNSLPELKKFSYVYLSLSIDFQDYITKALLYPSEQVYRLFDKNESDYRKFVSNLFNDRSLPDYPRAKLAMEFYRKAGKEGQGSLYTKPQLEKVIQRLFKYFLDTKPSYGLQVENFYYLNDTYKDGHLRVYHKKANELLRTYLITDQHAMDRFLELLIRVYTSPNDGQFTFYTHLPDIFPDISVIAKKLKEWKPGNEKRRLKELILFHLNTRMGDLIKPFHLDKKDQRYVLLHLKANGLYRDDDLF